MTGRRIVRPFALAAILATLVYVTERASRPVRRIRRAVAIATGTSLGWWWDPILQPFRQAYGALTGIVRSVTNIITGWVSDLFNALTAAVDNVMGMITTIISAISDTATAVWSAVTNITAHLIPTLAANVYNVIGGWVNQLRSDAMSGINAVRSFASFLFDSARQSAAALFNSLYGTAAAWVNDLRGFITGYVIPLIARTAEAMVAPFRATLASLSHWVADQLGSIRSWVAPVVDVVSKAWTWLVWLATHPFDWWRSAVEGLVTTSARWYVDAFTRTIAQEGDSVEQWVARWLGAPLMLAFVGLGV